MFSIELSLEKPMKLFLAAGFSVIPVINAFGTSKIKNSFVTVLTAQNGPKLKSLLEFTSRSISFILFLAQNDQA